MLNPGSAPRAPPPPKGPHGLKRPAWKMAPDLSRPLAPSSGNLDAFDALVTFRLLADAAGRVLGDEGGQGRLRREIAAAQALVAPWWEAFESEDPLDLGEALWLSHWFASGAPPRAGGAGGGGAAAAPAGSGGGDDEFNLAAASDHIAARALGALGALWEEGYFAVAPRSRLGFRELGASLGVQVHAATSIVVQGQKCACRREGGRDGGNAETRGQAHVKSTPQ
jgi:hypothetical protein